MFSTQRKYNDILVSNLVSKLFPQFNHKIHITFLRQVSVEHTPSCSFALSFRYLRWNRILFPIRTNLVCSLSFLCLLISYPFLKINTTIMILLSIQLCQVFSIKFFVTQQTTRKSETWVEKNINNEGIIIIIIIIIRIFLEEFTIQHVMLLSTCVLIK